MVFNKIQIISSFYDHYFIYLIIIFYTELSIFFIKDSNNVLYGLLLPKKMHGYNLRTRPHQHVLPIKNVYADKNFLDRMLYVDMY